jgi:TetR/AcrR family transcriptional repressor of bet genes
MPSSAKAAPRTYRPLPRTASKQVRRSQLIDATIASIAEHGIAGTTMNTVTERAGLSVGLANFHFQSKQRLLEETLLFLAREHHEQWYRAYADAGLDAATKLLAIVDAHFHPRICTRRKLAVWYAFFGEGGRRAVYRSLVDPMDQQRFELSTRLCEEIIAEGAYAGVSADHVARMLESLYDGLWLHTLMYPRWFSREGSKAQIRRYLATVFPQHFEAPAEPAAPSAAKKETAT